jgi:translation initiation factor IF-2
MTKKRVYELAKEMGLENKELIARLEKIGIAVRSHSSTLEDADLERIQAELLSPDPTEVVEQRIKSTVIRRRAIRTPVEEAKAEAPAPPTAPPEESAAAEPPAPAPAAPAATAPVPPPPPPAPPKEVPVRTSIYRDGGTEPAKIVVPPPP